MVYCNRAYFENAIAQDKWPLEIYLPKDKTHLPRAGGYRICHALTCIEISILGRTMITIYHSVIVLINMQVLHFNTSLKVVENGIKISKYTYVIKMLHF